jgi:hypothetical protein
MGHADENQVWARPPHQLEQARDGIACASCAEAVDPDCFWKSRIGKGRLGKQYEVHLVFAGAEVAGKRGNDVLSTADTEMWDEQKYSNARCRF